MMDDEYGPSRKRGPSRKLLAARYDGDILLESHEKAEAAKAKPKTTVIS